MTAKIYDVLVIGGGPAGMSAATEAANRGLRTALIDEQSTTGANLSGCRRCDCAARG